MIINIALVSQAESIATGDVMAVSAAIQKQIIRDFAPLWNIPATIDSFATLESVPAGYWPVIIVDSVATGDLGIHGQRDHQPIAMVEAKTDWSLTASHEVLEMIVDPFSNRLVAGDSVAGDGRRVEYLVEICDPCQDAAFGYQVNGVLVSNFYTPQYFNASGTSGAQYDYLGKMSKPRTILENGYLSWRDPATNHLHRADMINSQLWLSNLGDMPTSGVSLRSYIDSKPPVIKKHRVKKSVLNPSLGGSRRQVVNHLEISKAKAARLKAQFDSLK